VKRGRKGKRAMEKGREKDDIGGSALVVAEGETPLVVIKMGT